MTTYAIGDVQGCFDSFRALLDRLAFSPSRDSLWLVGDLVNRGPKSLDMLRWAKRHADTCTVTLGNHDLHLLGRYAGTAKPKKRDTLEDVLTARDRGPLIDWLRSQSLTHTAGDFAMVHAGLLPSWTIADAQNMTVPITTALRSPDWQRHWPELVTMPVLSVLTRIRTCRPDGTMETEFDGPPEEAPAGYQPWFSHARCAWHTHRVIFGHWSALGLALTQHAIGLDTGCVWGRQLTALDLGTLQTISVDAAESAP